MKIIKIFMLLSLMMMLLVSSAFAAVGDLRTVTFGNTNVYDGNAGTSANYNSFTNVITFTGVQDYDTFDLHILSGGDYADFMTTTISCGEGNMLYYNQVGCNFDPEAGECYGPRYTTNIVNQPIPLACQGQSTITLQTDGFTSAAIQMTVYELVIREGVAPCTESWSCTNYLACSPSNEEVCNTVVDNNACGTSYTGDYSEFVLACSYNTEPVLNSINPNTRLELRSGMSQLYTSDVTDTDGDAVYSWTLDAVEVSTSATYLAEWSNIPAGIYTLELTVSDAEYSNSLSTTLEIRAVGGAASDTSNLNAPSAPIVPTEVADEKVSDAPVSVKAQSRIGELYAQFQNWFRGLFN